MVRARDRGNSLIAVLVAILVVTASAEVLFGALGRHADRTLLSWDLARARGLAFAAEEAALAGLRATPPKPIGEGTLATGAYRYLAQAGEPGEQRVRCTGIAAGGCTVTIELVVGKTAETFEIRQRRED